jgi:hypothetical protein
MREQREERDDLAVHFDLVLDENEGRRRAAVVAFTDGHDAAACWRDHRGASPTAQVHAGMEQPAGRQWKEAAGAILAAEEGGPACAQKLVACARHLGERAYLYRKDEALQGAQDPFPIEGTRIPLLLVEIDVQVPDDAVKVERVFQRIHDDFAVSLGHLGLQLRKHAQEGSRERHDGFVLLGPKIVGRVLEAVDDDVAPGPRAPLGWELAHLFGLVAAAVADLDADGNRILLFGVVGAFGEIERLVDGAVGVDHEVGGKSAAGAAAGARAVVHGFEARARVDAAVEVKHELRHDGLQVLDGALDETLAHAVAVGVEVAAAAGLVDAALLVGVEALLVAPQDDGSPDVEGLARNDNGRAARCRWRGRRRGGRGCTFAGWCG